MSFFRRLFNRPLSAAAVDSVLELSRIVAEAVARAASLPLPGREKLRRVIDEVTAAAAPLVREAGQAVLRVAIEAALRGFREGRSA